MSIIIELKTKKVTGRLAYVVDLLIACIEMLFTGKAGVLLSGTCLVRVRENKAGESNERWATAQEGMTINSTDE